MIDRRIVKLNVSQDELASWTAPKGISFVVLEWIPVKEQAIIEFACSELAIDPLERKNMTDIRHILGTQWRNRLIEDNITNHPASPKRIMTVGGILNHPFITGEGEKTFKGRSMLQSGKPIISQELKKAADSAIDLHEIEMSPTQAQQNLKLGSTGEPLKIEPREVRQYSHLEQDLATAHARGGLEYKRVYEPERNVYVIGTIDSG